MLLNFVCVCVWQLLPKILCVWQNLPNIENILFQLSHGRTPHDLGVNSFVVFVRVPGNLCLCMCKHPDGFFNSPDH